MLAGYPPVMAAHAAVGTPVADAELPLRDGTGQSRILGDAAASVLVFFREDQERSRAALRGLARCRAEFAGKPVHWVGLVPESAPASAVEAMIRASGFSAPVVVDTGDAFYGSLGLSLHPVVVIVDRDRKLASFEPFRSVGFCPTVSAQLRHALREISDEALQAALAPPAAAGAPGGAGAAARRYRSLAEALFRSGNLDKALENARKSIEQDASATTTHVLVGEISLAQGNCPAAQAAFAQALALDPGNAAARRGRERCAP